MTYLHSNRALDRPAQYRIRSLGTLDRSWSEYFGGMTIHHVVEPECGHVTTLVGRLPDQAALIGVLNHLYDLGLALISVESLPEGPPGSESSVG
jgi:hypothetical protein